MSEAPKTLTVDEAKAFAERGDGSDLTYRWDPTLCLYVLDEDE